MPTHQSRSDVPQGPRSLRADAQQNKEQILKAARAVFAEQGYHAPLHLIAQLAGVGRATMQRRFPTREELIMTLADQNTNYLRQVAAEMVGRPDAFARILSETASVTARDRGFLDFFYRPEVSPHLREKFGQELVDILGPALVAGQAAGTVRAGIRPSDSVMIVDMLAGALIHPIASMQDPETLVARAMTFIQAAISPNQKGIPKR